MNNERGKFSLKFDTEKPEIDAAAYGVVLVNAVVLLDEITNEVEGFGKFNIKVVAEKKGSYWTEFTLQAGAAIGITSQMITPENILAARAVASKVISYLGKGLELVKKLGGEPPKSITQKGDKTVVVTGDGNIINVDNSIANVFVNNNPKAQGAASNIFSALSDRPEINGLEVLNEKEEKIFEANKADFPKLAAKITTKVTKERVRRRKATLTPFRQSYYPTSKSDFLFQGNRIRADIVAPEFWQRVEADEAFAKHDKLVVKLEIREELLPDLNAYKIKSYRILELIDHQPVAHQDSLFDGSDQPRELRVKSKKKRLGGKSEK